MNQSPFKRSCHLYDTPTFTLFLVSNEGQLKLAMHFVIFYPYDKLTFKTKALRLVSNEGRVKCLLLLYKWIIQRYLSLLWLQLAMHFTTRAMLINDIDGKSHKMELKSSRNYSTNHIKSKSRH